MREPLEPDARRPGETTKDDADKKNEAPKRGAALMAELQRQIEAIEEKLQPSRPEPAPKIRPQGHFTGAVTMEDVRAAKPRMIYYGANTCWWTHDRQHISIHPEAKLPCDPRGGMLYQTDNVEGFLEAAEANPDHYGAHGLTTFMAAHHLNMVRSETDQRPWCFRTFTEYESVVAREDEPGAGDAGERR